MLKENKKYKIMKATFNVLILILMEHAQRVSRISVIRCHNIIVLILILMEHAQRERFRGVRP